MRSDRETRRRTENEGIAIIAAITAAMWGITVAGLAATLPAWWTRQSDPLDNCAWSMVALCAVFTVLATWGLDTLLAARSPRFRAWRIAPAAITTSVVAALAVIGPPGGTRAGHLAFDVVAPLILVGFLIIARSTWRMRTIIPRATARSSPADR